MISINNITVSFSGNDLFDSVSFKVNDKDRIGLVGKNGAGKTTLLRVIKGILKPDTGSIILPNEARIGFLPQEMIINTDKNVLNETLEAFAEVLELDRKIHKYTTELSERTDFESQEYHNIIDKLNDANHLFMILGGHTMQADTERVLKGLGFSETDLIRPVKEFSSGWQMRVELAKILLQQPEVVLLDEPTNHLDIESIQWLEDYLVNYSGAVMLVSHDRAFLDNVTHRTIEISLGKIYDYKANYSEYVTMREERTELQMASFNNQQKEIEDIEKFINRFRYKATKSRQVQSRIKKLNKMEIIEVDETDKTAIHFLFPPAPHAGKVIIEAKQINKYYNEKHILKGVDFLITNGERIAFVGRNGEGKTTLTKVITGQVEYSGMMKLGHNVSIGYYAQNQSELLTPEKTVFQTIDDIAVGDIRKNIRAILGSFLFSGDTIDKKVKVLSGGEKSRLALAKLLLTPVNLLILDEPTNHLDMLSKDILKNALIKYDGTLIIVSHDRDFLQGITDKIFEFKNQSIKEFIGDIYEFLEARKLNSLKSLEAAVTKDKQNKKPKQVSEQQKEREEKKINERERKKINKEISDCEAEIEALENEIKEIDKVLIDPAKYKEALNNPDIYKKYNQFKKTLEEKMLKWEGLQNNKIANSL